MANLSKRLIAAGATLCFVTCGLVCQRQAADPPAVSSARESKDSTTENTSDASQRDKQEVALNPPMPSRRGRDDAPAQHNVARPLFRQFILENPNWIRMIAPYEPESDPPLDPRVTDTLRMSDDTRSDDFPCIAANPRKPDVVYMAWVSYSGQRDQVRVAPYLAEQSTWSTWNPVPAVSGDVWTVSLAYDKQDRLWVIWTQRVDDNYDLYARWFDGQRWGTLERLTSAAESDFNQRVAYDADGHIHIVWQGFRRGQADIFHTQRDDEGWSQPRHVSDSDHNDWEPAVALTSDGTAYIVWDTYDKGNYDVQMRSLKDGRLSPTTPIADTPAFEARPSVAVDGEDRIWIAYEAGPAGWAKDQGKTIPDDKAPGSKILEHREVKVVCLQEDHKLVPEPRLSQMLPDREPLYPTTSSDPLFIEGQLVSDLRGRIHLLFRAQQARPPTADYWRCFITTMTAQGWSKPAVLPHSRGRVSMRALGTAASNGGLWLAWPSDNHPTTSIFLDLPEETIIENVYCARYQPADAPLGAKLTECRSARSESTDDRAEVERSQVTAIRAHRIQYQGKELQILRGDLHRHTELSPDLQGTPDGSILDFFRYMLDAASMDFGALTDHQAGGDREYWWWLGQKATDLFHAPQRYVGMFGYERSINYPNGHRNIIHAQRGVMALPFFQAETNPIRLHNGIIDVLDDDTKLLYEELHKTGGVSIPHTTATEMGTDWRDNDSKVEPVVEIFQGDRYSYEHKGAPLSDPGNNPNQLQSMREDGMVWNAWSKNYRLGVIASSDHLSTHLSYAMVWVPERSREAILDAIKKRHTYAATDNIMLEFWLGEHMMGDEFSAAQVPPAKVVISGTTTIRRIVIVRNNQYVYSSLGRGTKADLKFQDMEPEPGLNYYYVRVEQEDNNVAWSSPIWVTLPKD